MEASSSIMHTGNRDIDKQTFGIYIQGKVAQVERRYPGTTETIHGHKRGRFRTRIRGNERP